MGDVDKVQGITLQHTCRKEDCGMKVKEQDSFWVVCPQNGCGQTDQVTGLVKSHRCSSCNKEMREDDYKILNIVSHVTKLIPGSQ